VNQSGIVYKIEKTNQSYQLAQTAIANLKAAIYNVVSNSHHGLKNSEIGRMHGIYTGHIRHEGHIPRTLSAIMEAEGVVSQDAETKIWSINSIPDEMQK